MHNLYILDAHDQFNKADKLKAEGAGGGTKEKGGIRRNVGRNWETNDMGPTSPFSLLFVFLLLHDHSVSYLK